MGPRTQRQKHQNKFTYHDNKSTERNTLDSGNLVCFYVRLSLFIVLCLQSIHMNSHFVIKTHNVLSSVTSIEWSRVHLWNIHTILKFSCLHDFVKISMYVQ